METREAHLEVIEHTIKYILSKKLLTAKEINQAENIYKTDACVLLTQSAKQITVEVGHHPKTKNH